MDSRNNHAWHFGRAPHFTPGAKDPGLYLLQGRWISLYYECQKPAEGSEHEHEEVEVTVLFAPASNRLRWRDEENEWRQLQLKGPCVCLLPPRIRHAALWECKAEAVMFYIVPALFRRFTGGAEALASLREPRPFVAHDFSIWHLASSVRALFRTRRKPDALYIDAIGSQLTVHLIWLLQSIPQGNGSGTRLSPDRLRRVTDFIHAHLTEPLQVVDLAKRVSLSPPHFTEVFRNTTGVAPYEYITQCRVLKANELLLTGEYRICDVATAVGFCDQSHLNRHFKKLLGYSPKNLLEQVRANGAKSTENP